MKKVLFLVDDYWHKEESIKPLAELLFPSAEWNLIFTKDPQELYTNQDIALLVSFKDPVENDQIPTPVWCDGKWTETFLGMVRAGTGLIAVHAAVTDLEPSHPFVQNLLHAVFLSHPQQCEVKVEILADHPVTSGVNSFSLPAYDEHYQMQMSGDITMLANTVSVNGIQPGLWVSEYGAGRICCFTPGHVTENLLCDGYVQIMRNAVSWCAKTKELL